MIIKYKLKHERDTWKGKMESIFGKGKSDQNKPIREGDYEYIPHGGWTV